MARPLKKQKKYIQAIIPETHLPNDWKGIKLQQLRTIVFAHITLK